MSRSTRATRIMERLIAGSCLLIAFVVMASIFSPGDSQATDEHDTPAVAPVVHEGTTSTNPHEGLPSLGTVEDDCYRVEIYGTNDGPRFTIIDRTDELMVGTLLTAEQVAKWFPDLPLPQMNIDDADSPIMLADPPVPGWRD